MRSLRYGRVPISDTSGKFLECVCVREGYYTVRFTCSSADPFCSSLVTGRQNLCSAFPKCIFLPWSTFILTVREASLSRPELELLLSVLWLLHLLTQPLSCHNLPPYLVKCFNHAAYICHIKREQGQYTCTLSVHSN